MEEPSRPEDWTPDQAPDLAAFVSHAKEDLKAAQAITAALEKRGLKCWIAPRDVRPGCTYAGEIIKGIERSRCFVLTLSKSSNQSAFVGREVERAISKRRPIFTIRIEPVDPSPGLELFISNTQWIDAFGGGTAEFDRLADLIAAAEGGEAPQAVPALQTEALPPAGRSRRGLLGAGLLAAVLLAGLGGFILWAVQERSQSLPVEPPPTDEPAFAQAPPEETPTPAPVPEVSEAVTPAETPAFAPADTPEIAPAEPPEEAPPALAEPEVDLPRPSTETEDCSRSGDTTICASSVLAPGHGNSYGPQNLTDGNDSTAWVEGRDGQGLGEFAVVEFGSPRMVRTLTIRNGYNKNADIFAKNSRAKDVEIRFSNGDSLEITLRDEPGSQSMALAQPIETKWIALVIRSVYPGSKYADTAINEISVDTD